MMKVMREDQHLGEEWAIYCYKFSSLNSRRSQLDGEVYHESVYVQVD